MTDKPKGIINSADDFDDFDLTLDDVVLSSNNTVEEETNLSQLQETPDDLDLDLDLNLADSNSLEDTNVNSPSEVPFEVEEKKEVEEKQKEIEDLDLDLTLDEEEEPKKEEPKKEEPKKEIKKGRPKKGSLGNEKNTPEIKPTILGIKSDKFFNSEFPLDKIEKNEQFQTRIKAIPEESINELAKLIENQGQIEPIRLYEKDGKFFILAGFRRFNSLVKLGSKTISAIIHRNLSEDDIFKISTGTNIGRLNLSDTDNIISIGEFCAKHATKAIEEIVKIFGYGKSSIYHFVKIYTFLKKYPKLFEVVSKTDFPLHVYSSIMEHTKKLPSVEEDLMSEIVSFLESDRLDFNNKSVFELKFSSFISERILDKKIENEEKNTDIEKIDLGTVDDSTKNINEIIEKAKKEEIVNEVPDETKERVTEIIKNIRNASDLIESELTDLLEIKSFKNYTDTSTITTIHKKMAKINDAVLRLI